MRLALTLSVLLVAVGMSPMLPTCEAQGWEAIALAIGQKVVGLWKDGNADFLGHACKYSVKPKIISWELYFKGRMWCPGWTPIRGEATTRSRSGVVGKTGQDFARKAFKAHIITEEQANKWLQSKQET